MAYHLATTAFGHLWSEFWGDLHKLNQGLLEAWNRSGQAVTMVQ